MLNEFEKFNRRLSGWFEWIGLAALLVMMALTCIDVIGAKVFKTPAKETESRSSKAKKTTDAKGKSLIVPCCSKLSIIG